MKNITATKEATKATKATKATIIRKEFVNEYRVLAKKDESAFSTKALSELNALNVVSQASACDLVVNFLIREKELTVQELSKLVAKDALVTSKVREFFIAHHIMFKNKNVLDSFKRLQRHLSSDTLEKLRKRSVQLT